MFEHLTDNLNQKFSIYIDMEYSYCICNYRYIHIYVLYIRIQTSNQNQIFIQAISYLQNANYPKLKNIFTLTFINAYNINYCQYKFGLTF